MIGFRCPEYAQGMNVPRYHFHFLSADKTKGGHVLGLKMKSGIAKIDVLQFLEAKLPDTLEFKCANLAKDNVEKIKAIEQEIR